MTVGFGFDHVWDVQRQSDCDNVAVGCLSTEFVPHAEQKDVLRALLFPLASDEDLRRKG